jgi:hypothetical protein
MLAGSLFASVLYCIPRAVLYVCLSVKSIIISNIDRQMIQCFVDFCNSIVLMFMTEKSNEKRKSGSSFFLLQIHAFSVPLLSGFLIKLIETLLPLVRSKRGIFTFGTTRLDLAKA